MVEWKTQGPIRSRLIGKAAYERWTKATACRFESCLSNQFSLKLWTALPIQERDDAGCCWRELESCVSWKPVEIVIGPTKTAKWAEGDNWDWKKPFLGLKKSTIRAEDKWHILLRVNDEEMKDVYAMCDGRHRVETIMELAEDKGTELRSERVAKYATGETGETGQNVDIKSEE